MQALIRATSDEDFPSAGRFRQVHEDGSFNSPAWVTRFILDQLVDGADAAQPGLATPFDEITVRVRVPDQH
jgi:hypothetical protein